MRVNVKKLSPDAKLPAKATPGASGFDLHAVEDCVLPAMHCRKATCDECGTAVVLHVPGRLAVRTGIALELEHGWEAQVRPRSGLAMKRGITCTNSPGTVDSDYRGEVLVLLVNHGGEEFRIAKGERIAQLVVVEVPPVSFCEVQELGSTRRGTGGFGSTGL